MFDEWRSKRFFISYQTAYFYSNTYSMAAKRFPSFEFFKPFKPLKDYFIQNRRGLLVGVACLLLVDFLQLLIPRVIKRAVDALTLDTATTGMLLGFGLIILAIAGTMAVLRYVWRYFLIGHSRLVEERLRNRLYNHLQALSPSFYNKVNTGDLMARTINDLNAVRMATGMGLVALTDGLVLGTAAIGFMIAIHPYLTLISLLPAPFIMIATRVLTRRMGIGYERVQNSFSALTEKVREAFSGIRVIKAYAREGWAQNRVQKEAMQYVSENMGLAKSVALFFPLMVIFTNLGLAIVIGFGGRLTILGHITTGDFVAFSTYLNLLTWPMMAMGWVTNLIQRGLASMRRINRVLEEVPDVRDRAARGDGFNMKGRIEFKGFSFRFPEEPEEILRDISMTIETGQTVAIVGRVGSGKSTLLQCIPRLHPVRDAVLFLDGLDVNRIPLRRLREGIGFVPQETVVFSDTIRNNVVFGREGVTEAALQSALAAAQVLDEMEALDSGLDAVLGERGITLSGGQRQRLTIARALICDPPILILDDALSMVDTRTEERILNEVFRRRAGRTNIIVSHRVATISRADIILVMERGRILEVGDHKGLLQKGGEYTRLYQRQMLAQELHLEM
jgi:ATP-binding cassette subfamily B protein